MPLLTLADIITPLLIIIDEYDIAITPLHYYTLRHYATLRHYHYYYINIDITLHYATLLIIIDDITPLLIIDYYAIIDYFITPLRHYAIIIDDY
jgi:hypothetical protein